MNTCPVIKVEYHGVCPNLGCPAHMKNLTGAGDLGCYYVHGRASQDSLQEVLQISVRKLKVEHRAGLQQIEAFVRIYKAAEEVQPQQSCSSCGISQPGGRACLNRIRCGRRRTIVDKIMQSYPFQHLNCERNVVWQMLQTNSEMLGLKPKTLARAMRSLSRLENTK